MIGGLGFCLYYYTISALPLGDAITVLSLNPVVTVTLASIVLKEEVTRSKVVAASCSILGCIMMARPSFLFGRSYVLSPSDTGLVNGADDADESTIDQQGVSTVGYLTGLMGACCGATVQVLIRKAGKQGVSTLNMLFSWCVFGLFISTSIVLLSPRAFIWPSSTSVWGYIFGACVSGTAAHFLMNYAARKIPAGVSSLIRSSGIIWSYFLEVVVFSQLPNLLTVIGVILILMSLVVVAMDKNRSSG
jgi:drug/metabolite transporter (DMT)-like permease